MLAFWLENSHVSVTKQVILTAGATWTVPADWNSGNNKLEAIGAAGGSDGNGGLGSGAGAYAKIINLALTPGAVIPIVIGLGGSNIGTDGGATQFRDGATLVAAGGQDAVNGALGGTVAASVGTTKFAGGNGSAGGVGGGGGAGGGAGGPGGAGANGGVAGTAGGNGGAAGGGGGGAGGFGGASGNPGNPGSAGAEWTTAGSGGGGGGGGQNGVGGPFGGGAGGNYGGGAGADDSGFLGAGELGANGVIVITYTT